MSRLSWRPFIGVTDIAVPFFYLIAPSWLSLMGIGPAWSILWLLPWSLVKGSIAGGLSGLALGLSLDSLSLGDATHVPALVILGLWWGYLGRRSLLFQRGFSLGLLAWIGSVLLGLSLWLQFLLIQRVVPTNLFNLWSFHTILAQAILTCIMAPLICSLLLSFFNRFKLLSSSNFSRVKS